MQCSQAYLAHEARYPMLLLTGAMARGVCALESSSLFCCCYYCCCCCYCFASNIVEGNFLHTWISYAAINILPRPTQTTGKPLHKYGHNERPYALHMRALSQKSAIRKTGTVLVRNGTKYDGQFFYGNRSRHIFGPSNQPRTRQYIGRGCPVLWLVQRRVYSFRNPLSQHWAMRNEYNYARKLNRNHYSR